MNVFAVCLIVLIAISCCLSEVPTSVLNGVYPGRSSEFVITPRNLDDDACMIQSTNYGEYQHDTIQDTEVVDLISHQLGLQPFHLHASRTNYPQYNFFARPKAELLISFDSIGESDFFPSSSFVENLRLKEMGKRIKINPTSFHFDSVAKLTTITSGSTPSEHGIISSVWNADGKRVNAYSSEGQSVISNFADTLSQLSDGKSLIISLSGDEKLSSSMCPHVITMSQHPFWNNFCFFWNSKRNFVEQLSVQLDNSFFFVQENIIERFPQQLLPSQFVVEKDSETVRIIRNSEITVFSLENKDDLLFLVELEMIRLLGNKIEKLSSFANDEHIDFYGLGISSLKNFKKQTDNNKFKIALEIMDAFIVDLAAKLDQTYKSKFISQLVFLGSESHAESISALSTKVSHNADMEQLFQGTPYQAYHIPNHHHTLLKRSISYFSTNGTNGTNGTNNGGGNNGTNVTYYTAEQVAIFHMCLWTPIAVAIVLIVFISSMYGIDAGDSIVMRASHAKVN